MSNLIPRLATLLRGTPGLALEPSSIRDQLLHVLRLDDIHSMLGTEMAAYTRFEKFVKRRISYLLIMGREELERLEYDKLTWLYWT